MTDKNKDFTFTLGVNRNPKGDNSPTHSGKVIINGKIYFLSGFQKETNGSIWYSGYVNDPENKQAQASTNNAGNAFAKPSADLNGDDIPF